MLIACLHTAESNVAVFEECCRSLGESHVRLRHEVRADLLAQAEANGGLTPFVVEEATGALLALSAQADAVVLTCSSLGPVASMAAQRSSAPLLRVDRALADEAVQAGGKVAVLCAVSTTLEPTRALFEAAAQGTGSVIEVDLVPSAWDCFKAGQRDRYLALIAEAADRAFAEGATTVALAQASMAGAAGLCRSGRPLTSPLAGLKAAAAMAASTGRIG